MLQDWIKRVERGFVRPWVNVCPRLHLASLRIFPSFFCSVLHHHLPPPPPLLLLLLFSPQLPFLWVLMAVHCWNPTRKFTSIFHFNLNIGSNPLRLVAASQLPFGLVELDWHFLDSIADWIQFHRICLTNPIHLDLTESNPSQNQLIQSTRINKMEVNPNPIRLNPFKFILNLM